MHEEGQQAPELLSVSAVAVTCDLFAWEATRQAASVIAPSFQGRGSVEALHRFPGWLHLESPEFWQKALCIELAGECHPTPETKCQPTTNPKY